MKKPNKINNCHCYTVSLADNDLDKGNCSLASHLQPTLKYHPPY